MSRRVRKTMGLLLALGGLGVSGLAMADHVYVAYDVRLTTIGFIFKNYDSNYASCPWSTAGPPNRTFSIFGSLIGKGANSTFYTTTPQNDYCNRSLTWQIANYKQCRSDLDPGQVGEAGLTSNMNITATTGTGAITVSYKSQNLNVDYSISTTTSVQSQMCSSTHVNSENYSFGGCGMLQDDPGFIGCCYYGGGDTADVCNSDWAN